MKLKIRYEDTYQSIELGEKEIEELWFSLELESSEELTCEELEKLIQEAFDERYNKPEYNCWHKHNRHIGFSKAMPGKDDTEEDVDSSEPLMDEVFDDRIFRKDELAREEAESYEAICCWVRQVLKNKPKWADAFIAVHMDEIPTKEHAASIGVDPSTVTHWLRRAEKKLREKYEDRQF